MNLRPAQSTSSGTARATQIFLSRKTTNKQKPKLTSHKMHCSSERALPLGCNSKIWTTDLSICKVLGAQKAWDRLNIFLLRSPVSTAERHGGKLTNKLFLSSYQYFKLKKEVEEEKEQKKKKGEEEEEERERGVGSRGRIRTSCTPVKLYKHCTVVIERFQAGNFPISHTICQGFFFFLERK